MIPAVRATVSTAAVFIGGPAVGFLIFFLLWFFFWYCLGLGITVLVAAFWRAEYLRAKRLLERERLNGR